MLLAHHISVFSGPPVLPAGQVCCCPVSTDVSQRMAGMKGPMQKRRMIRDPRGETSRTANKDMGLPPQARRMSTVVSTLNWASSAKGRSLKTHWGHAIHRLANVSICTTLLYKHIRRQHLNIPNFIRSEHTGFSAGLEKLSSYFIIQEVIAQVTDGLWCQGLTDSIPSWRFLTLTVASLLSPQKGKAGALSR